jgi:hypothetical protein
MVKCAFQPRAGPEAQMPEDTPTSPKRTSGGGGIHGASPEKKIEKLQQIGGLLGIFRVLYGDIIITGEGLHKFGLCSSQGL